jgi:hypothetical protein
MGSIANKSIFLQLVGTGTALAVAATGLVLAQPIETDSASPSSNLLKTTPDPDYSLSNRQSGIFNLSRPGTSSAGPATSGEEPLYNSLQGQSSPNNTTNSSSRQARPQSNQYTPPKGTTRRQSFIRQEGFGAPPIAEDSRDSVSSTGSWMRRLSIRPLSQHGSPRSSVGPDSPSLTFSHGSAAPMLSTGGPAPAPLPPNKLVKRAPSNSNDPTGTVTRRRSRSHLPTLRRPATSHQRSATLQQFHQNMNQATPIAGPKYSLDQHVRPTEELVTSRPEPAQRTKGVSGWVSFFHSRTAKIGARAYAVRSTDSSPNSRSLTSSKRICVNAEAETAVYLIQPSMVSSASTAPAEVPTILSQAEGDSSPAHNSDKVTPSPEDTPSKGARRSISMHFSSPTSWISRTGSIRRPKRGAPETKPGGKRHVSAPVTGTQPPIGNDLLNPADDYSLIQHKQGIDVDPAATTKSRHRKRNSSSPLPPLSRLSSFNIDLSRLGASNAATSPQGVRPTYPSGSSQSSAGPLQGKGAKTDRSSTLNSSDMEARDFNSGDDDDTDFKSDTMFDSVRTVASGHHRAVETPLESMFDESPPSTAGNGKTKRLSIQEILGKSWEGENRIMEEDEGLPTPVRDTYPGTATDYPTRPESAGSQLRYGQRQCSLGKDFSRPSFDDDFDEDWDKDDEDALSGRLSPPSNSLNSRGVSPNVRTALANISGNGSPETHYGDANGERPRSTVFDWTESSIHDKYDADGRSPRPKTVHGKQEMDVRGGRSATRKGPTATHVRSQSVPVVQDPTESSKPATSKFGTWALGTKTVSEDWDDDFEFEEVGDSGVEGRSTDLAMLVPASIQASQPSVKAHSGQIRELSLLVNDLKRLCRHGRNMEMLGGPHASLWTEAEGIIALASPDEENPEDSDAGRSSTDRNTSKDRFLDVGFDGDALDRSTDDPFEIHDLTLSKNGVVRERHAGRRRSVFSPDDDIFGGNGSPANDAAPASRPKTPENNAGQKGHDVTVVVRSVMEAMQQRAAPEIPNGSVNSDGKLHFGTGSLKALVKRAGDLRDALSDIVRRADPITQSPARTPRHDGSPAFTRVFTDPSTSPPKRLPHSRSNNSALGRPSLDASPSNGINQRMHMMTVS